MLGPLLIMLMGSDSVQAVVSRLEIVKQSMTLFRKVMRFGMIYQALKAISHRHISYRHSLLDLLRTISDCILIVFYATDHALLFQSLQYLPMTSETCEAINVFNKVLRLSNRLFEITIDTCDYMQIDKRRGGAHDLIGQDLKKGILTSIVLNALDIPPKVYFLNLGVLGPIQAGLCGTIASLVSLVRM